MKKSVVISCVTLLVIVFIIVGCEVINTGTTANVSATSFDFLEVGGEYTFSNYSAGIIQVQARVIEIDESGWVYVQQIGGSLLDYYPEYYWLNISQVNVLY